MNYFIESVYNYPEIEFDDTSLRVGEKVYPYPVISDIVLDRLMPFATYGLMHVYHDGRESSVVIPKSGHKTIRQALREVKPLLGNEQAAVKRETPVPVSDPYEEMKKLKELLDLDIITQEEFDKKKKELLDL